MVKTVVGLSMIGLHYGITAILPPVQTRLRGSDCIRCVYTPFGCDMKQARTMELKLYRQSPHNKHGTDCCVTQRA
jgi:hypothetical protein